MAEYEVFGVDELATAVRFIKSGGVLAYPSESVWGLGCDAFDDKAVGRIFELKARPEHKGLIVLTDSVDKLAPLLADLPSDVQVDLMAKMRALYGEFDSTTDQAQTWLVPVAKSVGLPDVLTGGFDTLAVRATHHPVLQELCRQLTDNHNPFGFLISTSCNPSGEPSAQSLQQAVSYFGDKVAYLDAQSLGFNKPSQIIDIMTGRVLR